MKRQLSSFIWPLRNITKQWKKSTSNLEGGCAQFAIQFEERFNK